MQLQIEVKQKMLGRSVAFRVKSVKKRPQTKNFFYLTTPTGQKDKKLINDDGHCRIHAKWKDNATFCAALLGCKMKNVWKAPQ